VDTTLLRHEPEGSTLLTVCETRRAKFSSRLVGCCLMLENAWRTWTCYGGTWRYQTLTTSHLQSSYQNAYHFTPLPQRLELTAVTHSTKYTPGRRRTETHLHLSQTVNAPQAMKTAFVPEEGLQRCHYYRYIMPLWYSRCHVFTLRMSIEWQLCGHNSRFARATSQALPHWPQGDSRIPTVAFKLRFQLTKTV
jgi:hypothetical protein